MVSPKSGTTTLLSLFHSDEDFLSSLTGVIVEVHPPHLMKAAVPTFCRFASKLMKDPLSHSLNTLDRIYALIKRILLSERVLFTHKKLLLPCLTTLF